MYINPFNKSRGFVRHELVLLMDRLSLFEFIVRTAWNSVLFFSSYEILFVTFINGLRKFFLMKRTRTNYLFYLTFQKFDFSNIFMSFPFFWHGLLYVLCSQISDLAGWGKEEMCQIPSLEVITCFFFSGWGCKWIISKVAFCGMT